MRVIDGDSGKCSETNDIKYINILDNRTYEPRELDELFGL